MAKQTVQLDLSPELTKRALEQALASARRSLNAPNNRNATVQAAINEDIAQLQSAISTIRSK